MKVDNNCILQLGEVLQLGFSYNKELFVTMIHGSGFGEGCALWEGCAQPVPAFVFSGAGSWHLFWRLYTALNGNKWMFENKPCQLWEFLVFHAHSGVCGCPISAGVQGQAGWGTAPLARTGGFGMRLSLTSLPTPTTPSFPDSAQKVDMNPLTESTQEQLALKPCWNPWNRHQRWFSRWAQHPLLFSIPEHSIMLLGLSFNHWEPAPDFGIRTKLQSIVSFVFNIFTEILCLKRWQQSWGYSH